MQITKDDLVFKHYEWSDSLDEQREDLMPSRKLFNRNNGTHILWIINWYATEVPTFQKENIIGLETLLADKLPSDVLSEKSVCQWLVNR